MEAVKASTQPTKNNQVKPVRNLERSLKDKVQLESITREIDLRKFGEN